jgi:hypothetical protein
MHAESVSDIEPGRIVELPEAPTRAGLAVIDLIDGIRNSWLWTTLAEQDVKLR